MLGTVAVTVSVAAAACGTSTDASNATAHLFISNPFGSGSSMMGAISRLFMTHPPVEDRIHALLGEKENPKLPWNQDSYELLEGPHTLYRKMN